MDDDFEVAPAWRLKEKYGLNAANRPVIHLDSARVPEKYRRWIPLAERWGIGDDIIRDDCLDHASPEELRDILAYGEVVDDVLTDWLAGPEAESPDPTEEYVAFTCLMMAWDYAKVIASRRNQATDS